MKLDPVGRTTLVVLAIAAAVAACGGSSSTEPEPEIDVRDVEFAPELGVNLGEMTRHSSGLYFQDLTTGEGTEARPINFLEVHYMSWLSDGTLVDDTRAAGQPFDFLLGVGEVIPGWDLGLVGARAGGTRRLILPPQLAYGSLGRGPVPPLSTLVFDIEVLDVVRP